MMKKKNSPCPTHHFFSKTGLPGHKPLLRFSFWGDNNQEFKWSAVSLALWIARVRPVKEAAGVCPLNMCTSEELRTKQELMLVIALEDVVSDGESWIMLLESFRFEDEDEIYLGSFSHEYSQKLYTPRKLYYFTLPLIQSTPDNSNPR